MTQNPWHPRFTPYALYGVFLLLIQLTRSDWPATYPIIYTVQCLAVAALLWRCRRLLPEITFGFHWSSLVAGVAVLVAWIVLGWWSVGELPIRFEALQRGELLGLLDYRQLGVEPSTWATPAADGPLDFRNPRLMGPTLGWITLVLRLLGMSLLVPIFEELIMRSLFLRGLHRLRPTAAGIVQMIEDMPIIGDWLMHTELARRAGRHVGVFTAQFHRHRLGELSLFGVTVSTLIFALGHRPSDYLGAIFCGVAYCLVVWITNRPSVPLEKHLGLGPVIWAHGLTNALLWGYTLATGDWQFL